MDYKKTLALLLCVSAHAFAAAPATKLDTWDMGVEGGLFTQSSEGTGYTYNLNEDNTANGNMVYVEPGFKFSGGANLRYHFNNGQDVNLSVFIRKNHANDSHVFSGVTDDVATPRIPSDWGDEDAFSANSKFSYESDEIDLTTGYTFSLSQKIRLHPYSGLGLRKAVFDQTTNYLGVDGTEGNNANIYEKSKAQGLGVVVGAGLNWFFSEDWAVNTDTNLAILTGKIKSSYLAQSNYSDHENVNLIDNSKNSVFEEVTAKIGLSRDFSMNSQEGNFTFGYRISKYFNTAKSNNFVDNSHDSNIVSRFTDSAYSGFYASLNMSLS